MKIRMLQTVPGSVDGVTVRVYAEGEDVDLSHTAGARDLAAVFVREGWAEPVNPIPGPVADPPAKPKRPRKS